MEDRSIRALEKLEMFRKYNETHPVPGQPELFRDASDRQAGPDHLPFEPIDSFSSDSVSFEEMTSVLWEEAEETYYHTQVLNRHSGYYFAACHDLEKLLKELGSCCVTKAVLEKKGFAFPALDELTVEKLYGMLSFNFRKCRAAILELRQRDLIPESASDMLNRWYLLAERLIATGERIEKIRSGKIDADKLIEAPDIRVQKPKNSAPDEKALPVVVRKPASLPVSKAKIRRELCMNGKEDGTVPDTDAETEKRRRILMDEALFCENGDEFAELLNDAPKEEIDVFWQMRPCKTVLPDHSEARTGPPPETRKMLREKRKKRK